MNTGMYGIFCLMTAGYGVPLLQIVSEADKVYGVMHANRISQIDVITSSDALAFLQSEEEQHQEQQQQQRHRQQGEQQQQQQQQQSKRSRTAA